MNKKENQPAGQFAWLAEAGLDRRIVALEPEETFFCQGDAADCVYILETGRAKISVVSEAGKQATISLVAPGDFFGELALAANTCLRLTTVTALNACTAFKIGRDDMTRAMHEQNEFCDQFLSHLLARNIRTQAALMDQIFHSSEKRLARTLLRMAESGNAGEARTMIPPITQETLAEMVGTTRSRVSFFMNRFRDLGLISYGGRIHVHTPRLKSALTGKWPLCGEKALQAACAS